MPDVGLAGIAVPAGVRAVMFDAVGTLIAARPAVAEVYATLGAAYGSRGTEQTLAPRIRAAYLKQWSGRPDSCQSGEELDRRRWRAVVTDVFSELTNVEALFDELWAHFGLPSSWRLYDDVPECLSRLQSQGYRLGIASNFDERLRTIVAGHPELAACLDVFCASTLGWRKPDRRFFEAIERSLRLRPNEILLVGDVPVEDYAGATAAGWHSLLLERRTKTGLSASPSE